jgi:glycosyltransferase involved in cell wall biosynthesis
MSPPAIVHGDVDPPRPTRARDGYLVLHGWCFVAGESHPPDVRLAGQGFALPATRRAARDDVAQAWPAEPAARACGFTIEGHLPAGVHLATVEARLPGGWQPFRNVCVAVESRPLAAGIDELAPAGTFSSRVHVEGWALHPAGPVRQVTLRYGHQEIPCTLGRPRPDLAALHPDSPAAAVAGFKSEVILSAGHGPLRIKATLADGGVAIAPTAIDISIPTDENVGREIDLAGSRTELPRTPAVAADEPVAPAPRPLNILFVLYGSFVSNSAHHVAALANELAAAGHACIATVPGDLATFDRLPAPRFTGLLHADAARGVTFPDGRGPDVIHAWTTRENVRLLATRLRDRHGARLVVHLEDNEQHLLATTLGIDAAELAALPEGELDRRVPADLSHPVRSRAFLASADGVTVIVDSLREFVPAGRPCLTLPPAADARYFYPRPVPPEFRAVFQRQPDELVVFYHGNVHASNAAEMCELYAAIAQLNAAGTAVTLLRAGRDAVDFLGDLAPAVAPFVINLGELRHHHQPAFMALADVFVQPGWDDAFNRYRLPSKLPEFFALGRPVVLPRTNLGHALRHDVDAWVLDRADAAGIATALAMLGRDSVLRRRLGEGAAAFARAHFSWRRSAAALASFLTTVTG